MDKLRFSGHESFHCRHFWLKKGYDFLDQKGNLNDEDSTSKLGVGKNMVASINYWMKAFGIKEEEGSSLTKFGKMVFGNTGFDPFLEDIGTLWLLQYYLVSSGYASIYSLAFKELRKKHLSSRFTLRQLEGDIKKALLRANVPFSENTIQTDIRVFVRSYFVDTVSKRDLEDSLSSILIDLNLLSKLDGDRKDEGDTYRINVTEREEIPTPIFLFAILDQFTKDKSSTVLDLSASQDISVSFDQIQAQVADCFACNREGLEKHIAAIQENYPWIVYKEDAGRKEIQIKSGGPSKWQILHAYYD